jgi:hypothetical protein
MNQGPRWVRLIEKSRWKKSRATVPLSKIDSLIIHVVCIVQYNTHFSLFKLKINHVTEYEACFILGLSAR